MISYVPLEQRPYRLYRSPLGAYKGEKGSVGAAALLEVWIGINPLSTGGSERPLNIVKQSMTLQGLVEDQK